MPYRRLELTKRKGQVVIMDDCWIGYDVTIMSGVTIGNGSVVAAEVVIMKNFPSFAIVTGNSAKIIGYRFEQKQIYIRWKSIMADWIKGFCLY